MLYISMKYNINTCYKNVKLYIYKSKGMFGVSLHRQDRTLYVNKILTKKTGSRHSLVEKSLNIVEGFFCEIYMMLNKY
jgi:hypothetical protein